MPIEFLNTEKQSLHALVTKIVILSFDYSQKLISNIIYILKNQMPQNKHSTGKFCLLQESNCDFPEEPRTHCILIYIYICMFIKKKY